MSLDHKIKNLILQKITGLNKEQLFLNPPTNPLPNKDGELYEKLVQRYNSWEPIEYIVENVNFYGLDFFVDSRVLVPRDDTEIMVEEALMQDFDILIDVWTWSSCIPISILKNKEEIKKCFVIDISNKALEVSKINIKKHNLENKINQVEWSLLSNFLVENPLAPFSGGKEHLFKEKEIVITANLPYIKDWDCENIDNETLKFEPGLALYWWEKTWFELYERLVNQAITLKEKFKIKSIILFIEIGFDQKKVSETFLKNLNLNFEFFKDNNTIHRCIKIFI